MNDILENQNIKFQTVPNTALHKQKANKFVDAVEYASLELEGLEEKYNKIKTEKEPISLKLRIGFSVNEIGILNVSSAELEYE